MKSDISALLDDELAPDQANRAIDALRRDTELQNAWSVYHLIGDTLRDSPAHSPDLAGRVMERLAEEPVLFAPSAQPKRSSLHLALPMAAAIAGVAVAGWVALSLNAPAPIEIAVKAQPAEGLAVSAPQTPPSGALKEYLVAHQAHSPSGRIQGVAPYVRSVSEIRRVGRP